MHVGFPTFYPNLAQWRFIQSKAKFRLMLGGTGSGKTHLLTREFFRMILSNPAGHDMRYLVGAPSNKIMRDATFDHCRRFLNEWKEHNDGVALHTKILDSDNAREIYLRGGTKIVFITLKNEDSYAGPTISGWWIDELALLGNGMKAMNMLNQRLRGPGTRFGMASTTPRGPVGAVQHWIDECDWDNDAGKMGPNANPLYYMTHTTTWDNVQHVGLDYIADMLPGMSQREVEQQLFAKVLDYQGAIYSGSFSSHASMARGWTAKHLDGAGIRLYQAIDWGPNYPHVLFIAHDEEQDIDIVFDEFVEDGLHAHDLLELSNDYIRRKYGIERHHWSGVYCDGNPPADVETAFGFFGRPVKASDQRRKDKRRGWVPVRPRRCRDGQEVRDGINTVAGRLKRFDGKRRLFFGPELEKTKSRRRMTQCMRLYGWATRNVDSETVMDDLRPKKGLYDHGPDALRTYCWQRYVTIRAAEARRAA